ncbi:hypothetical protein CYY_003892 [Polysphondylium violaceum]|uniref:RabGAP/TBC domain-containing protein n=1 Tax=Polysphondylium violaceum TaxID=133409 RepID=A0A8J4V892_9MYCE|nr:hypothetical protein CYY_003892 [Polysphondylium violaceum]
MMIANEIEDKGSGVDDEGSLLERNNNNNCNTNSSNNNDIIQDVINVLNQEKDKIEQEQEQEQEDPNVFFDMYGFEYDKEKDKALIQVLKEQKTLEDTKVEEWSAYIKNTCSNIDDIIRLKRVFNEESFLDLLYQGIPSIYRKSIWTMFLDCYQQDFKKDYYWTLLHDDYDDSNQSDVDEMSDDDDDNSKSKKNHSSFVYQNDIISDLERTFPNHPKSKDEEFKKTIKRILLVYSITNPSVGYCQSLNYIVFFLLMITENEELTFWCLCHITDKLLPDYYTHTMLGAQIDQNVLIELIQELFPELIAHFKSIGAIIQTLSIEWFLCIFTVSLPAQSVLIIWDNLFLRGSKVLLEVALALIEMNLSALLKTKNHAEVVSILSNKPFNKDLFSTIQNSFKRIGVVLSKKKIINLKQKHWEITKQDIKEKEEEKEYKYLVKQTQFSIEKLKSLKSEFNILSHDGTGIGFLQFQQLMLRFLPDWKETDIALLEKLFASMDEDQDKLLNFKEIVKGISTLSNGNVDQILTFIFKLFAIDNDYLTKNQVKALINHVDNIYFKPYFKDYPEETTTNYIAKKEEFIDSLQEQTSFEELKKIASENPLILESFQISLTNMSSLPPYTSFGGQPKQRSNSIHLLNIEKLKLSKKKKNGESKDSADNDSGNDSNDDDSDDQDDDPIKRLSSFPKQFLYTPSKFLFKFTPDPLIRIINPKSSIDSYKQQLEQIQDQLNSQLQPQILIDKNEIEKSNDDAHANNSNNTNSQTSGGNCLIM